MSNVILTNPKGEKKELPYEGFVNLLAQFERTNQFRSWAKQNAVTGYFEHAGRPHLNTCVIKIFLLNNGYRIDKG